MKRAIAGVGVIVTMCSVSPAAQWPKYQAPGVPRDAEGGVRMDAPTPRTPDGKPDFSGNWIRVRGEGAFAAPELSGLTRNQAAAARPPAPPADPNSPPIGAFWEIGANVPGGLPLTPWAEELKKQRMAVSNKENPDANCLPMGLTQFHMHGQPRKVMQNSSVIAIMYEANYGLRYIYIDGRTLPPQGSCAAVLVRVLRRKMGRRHARRRDQQLEGSGIGPLRRVARRAWQPLHGPGQVHRAHSPPDLRQVGNRHHVDDPKAYTRPFTVRVNQQISPDDEIIEFICNENQQFRRRVKID